jgi:two-component system CheB/CheR fusion protein
MNIQDISDSEYEKLRLHVISARAFDGTLFGEDAFKRAVAVRLRANGLSNLDEFIDYLEVRPAEYHRLFQELFTEETYVPKPAWLMFLQANVLPQLTSGREPIRIWHVGCGTGEFACILAGLLCQQIGLSAFQSRVKIFATDMDDANLAFARHASYSNDRVKQFPDDVVAQCFTPVGNEWTIRTEIRRLIIFGKHDILTDPPISKMDLIICRGVLPLHDRDRQQSVLVRLRFALRPERWLQLGRGELVTPDTGFNIVDPMSNLYLNGSGPTEAGQNANGVDGDSSDNKQSFVLHDCAFDGSPIANIVVDANGVVAMANAEARSSFGLIGTDFGRPLQDLEISYRPIELRSLIERARSEGRQITVKNVPKGTSDGDAQFYNVHVRPLFDRSGSLRGTNIQFEEITEFHTLKSELTSLNQQLQTANEELQSAHEELETTNEELQSTNEELETTNEELQSTNEELETMNEELRSTNSELEATNSEQRELTNHINTANTFLESILASIQSAVIVLTSNFEVLVWNRRAADLFGLRSDEVVGQNFFSLDIGLPVDRLRTPLKEFIVNNKKSDTASLQAINRRGRNIECSISINSLNDGRTGIALIIDDTESPNANSSGRAAGGSLHE